MKKTLFGLLVFSVLFAAYACASESGSYNTQKGAAIGAVGGALAGQAIGGNTAGTLIGAASGAVVGAVAGSALDEANAQRMAQQSPPPSYHPPPPGAAVAGPPPPLYAPAAPPEVVPIPGTYAYFVPGIEAEIVFYHGLWYQHFRGHWYSASYYNGPWVFMPGPRVPRVLVTLPHGWRRVPPGYRPIPHAELQKHWGRWEREKHWDDHHRDEHHRDEHHRE